MKNTFIVILAVTTVALGAWSLSLRNKIEEQSAQLAQLAALQEEAQEKDKALERAKASMNTTKLLKQNLAETAASAAEQSRKAEQLQQSLDAAKTDNPMRAMASMFKDPKMREMMKSQQKTVLAPMIEKQYRPFLQQFSMTPEQSAAFKELMQKKMFAGADIGFSMLDDSLDASQRAELVKQVKAQTDAVDQEVKEFLGDENYAAFQAYEKTVPDRMVVGQFSDLLGTGATALSAGQEEQLIQALSEARNDFKWSADSVVNIANRKNPGAEADFTSALTEENITKFTKERSDFDDKFFERARQILTAEQLTEFQDFQKTQRDLQIAQLKMAAQMFGQKNH